MTPQRLAPRSAPATLADAESGRDAERTSGRAACIGHHCTSGGPALCLGAESPAMPKAAVGLAPALRRIPMEETELEIAQRRVSQVQRIVPAG